MIYTISGFIQIRRQLIRRLATLALFTFTLGGIASSAVAQQPGQQTFASADDAVRAFFAAMQKPDDQGPLSILGPTAKDVLSSGDTMEDEEARSGFVAKYEEMHRLVTESDGTVTLVIGAENWPFPIPLVNDHGSWYFDTSAGKDEIIFRRIGKNEIAAVDACHQLVDAEKQYFARPPAGFPKQFAQKLVSDEGRHNGLYWYGTSDEFNSPIDPLIASAGQENAKSVDAVGGDPMPFNGYFFRILKSQGKDAPGGAKSYIVNGKMVDGFAFIAYPAEYRSSGVMTFIVDQRGAVYEKDLGPNTVAIATTMTGYNPDSTWHQVD
ncbi:MAG TPA: DUF2950 domain-containing protein [Candidatus Acidoferrum sp.]|nr:DUF2950 domain-containing protein [Candidatus Acidoferrum sp.]